MEAILTSDYGAPEVLSVGEFDTPKLNSNSVLVENHYFSVNPVDCGVRAGEYKLLSGKTVPSVLGADFSGVIKEIGENVTRFKVGDKVVGMLNPFKGGAYSQAVACPEHQITHAPSSIEYKKLAAMPLVSLTAYQALVKKVNLKAGETLVVNGATGGVGHVAIQLGKHIGAKVIAVCHPDQSSIAYELGADEVLSYKDDFLDEINNIDVFFDVSAMQKYKKIKSRLSSKGRYITTLPNAYTVLIAPLINKISKQQNLFIGVKPRAKDLKVLVSWLEQGIFDVRVHQEYSMHNIKDAHKRMNQSGVIGKLIVSTK